MKKQPTYNDFQNAKPSELQKHYKISQGALEMQFRRKALDGATQPEMRKEYEKFFRRNRIDA